MNVLMATYGTFGDVNPFLGLGRTLRQRGHCATLLANERFEAAAKGAGLGFRAVGMLEEYHQLFQDPAVWGAVGSARILGRQIVGIMSRQYEAVVDLAQHPDTVIVSSGAAFGARIAHEKLGVPLVTVVLQPNVFPSAELIPVIPGLPRIPSWIPLSGRRLMVAGFLRGADRIFLREKVNAFRENLGLLPVKRMMREWWLSPRCVIGLFPDWFGLPQSDWPKQVRLTSFPLCDGAGTDDSLSPELVEFLDAGSPPIAFTPGTGMMHARSFFATAVEVCSRLERRALLLTSYVDQIPADLPSGIRHEKYVPFGTLLPRCAALVHHGGVGTLSQALAAGIPQLIMPLAYDQPDNAWRLRKLGVAESIRPKNFKPDRVFESLTRLLTDSRVAGACEECQRRTQSGRGIEQACDLIERAGTGQ